MDNIGVEGGNMIALADGMGTNGTEAETPTDNPRGRSRRLSKHGSLASIVTVPLDVFAEVASYLNPLDIISLARSTKHFRTLLMQPSAKYIWHAAERSVPGLPECPSHMAEPAYAALVFVKACSLCGATVPKNPDPELYIRLCNNCTDINMVAYIHVPTAVQPYVSMSRYIKPPTLQSRAYVLRKDVDTMTNKLIELASLRDPMERERWKALRCKQLAEQKAHSILFKEYLRIVEMIREGDLEGLKVRRAQAVRERLIRDGWEEIDTHITHLPLMRAWRQLVWQPKPLTDRIWNNLFPRLKPIVQANREQRLVREREQRRNARHTQIIEYLNNIKENQYPYIELATTTDIPTTPALIERLRLPFPTIESLRKLSFLECLWENDIDAEAATSNLVSWRSTFDSAISWWRRGLEVELVKMLSEDNERNGQPAGPIKRCYGERKRQWLKRTILPTTSKFTSESETHIYDTTSSLLRADSIFFIVGSSKNYFYPEIVHERERQFPTRINVEQAHDYNYEQEVNRLVNLDTLAIKVNSQAQYVAGELLYRLDKTHASHLEMKGVGQMFSCTRCWNKQPIGWLEMIEHYITEYRLCQARSEFYSQQGLSIIVINVHDLEGSDASHGGTRSDDARCAFKPTSLSTHEETVEVMTQEDASLLLSASLPSPLMGCRLCHMVPSSYFGVKGPPKGSKELIEKHLTEEHSGTSEVLWEAACYAV